MLRDWYAHMAGHGITEEEADAHFAQWAEERSLRAARGEPS
jgi:hypothetical protein